MEKLFKGYKQPYDMFGGGSLKDTLWTKLNYYMYSTTNKTFSLPKEIVERWEPVFDEEKCKTINLCGLKKSDNLLIKIFKDRVSIFDIEFKIESFREFLKIIPYTNGYSIISKDDLISWDVQLLEYIPFIQLDCGDKGIYTLSIKDIKIILETSEKL